MYSSICRRQCLLRATVNLEYLQKNGLSIWSPLAEAFNTRPSHKFNYRRENIGLFGVPELTSSEGFNNIEHKCIKNTNNFINEALSNERNTKMVEIFDNMSDSLCQVADLAEFIRLAHPDNKYRRAAENACCAVSGVVEKLNTNLSLYRALKEAVNKLDIDKNTVVDKHVGELFLIDFEQCGIHLPKLERNKVVALTDEILSLGQQFVANSSTPRLINKFNLPNNVRNILTSDGDTIVGKLNNIYRPISVQLKLLSLEN